MIFSFHQKHLNYSLISLSVDICARRLGCISGGNGDEDEPGGYAQNQKLMVALSLHLL